LNLNGFISKIIQYMAAGRDNSSNLGSGLPTRSPSRENLSGGNMHNALGSHFTKKTPILPLLGTTKIENPLFMWQVKKTLVTKVVGTGKMHNPAKNGVKIWKFAMELAQTMVN
jgi:hypothetical protein